MRIQDPEKFGMALESLVSNLDSPPSLPEGATTRVKFRIRFRKAGDLRLVSHHDLMHLFERTFRRADLRLLVTQGFNPHPKMVFALSLALGTSGLNEVLEIEMSDALAPEEVQHRLAAHCPPGIDILSVHTIEVRASAKVRRTWYRLPFSAKPAGDIGAGAGSETNDPASSFVACELEERAASFLAQADCWIERIRPNRRRINLRPFVSELHVRDCAIEMALWISPKGAARPEEIVAALGLSSWFEDGAVMERTDLEIIDELPPGTDGPPALEHAFEKSQTNDQDFAEEAAVSSRPTAIISNPLSFET